MGTHLIEHGKSLPMNTNIEFKQFLRSCAFDESSLSIERVNELGEQFGERHA